MNLGAEPKKVALLSGILLVGAVAVWYANSDEGGVAALPSSQAVTAAPVAAAPGIRTPGPRTKAAPSGRRQTSNRATATAWTPRLGAQNPEDRPDPATVDPALKLDLLAKVQAVELGAPGRNLFVFGAAPPAHIDLPKAPTISTRPPVGPLAPPPPPVPAMPAPPSAPPMTLKYYGFKVSRSDGHKAAFLLDGEDILIGGENDILKKHYRIVRINTTSIVIEDTDFKTTQTLPIQESAAV